MKRLKVGALTLSQIQVTEFMGTTVFLRLEKSGNKAFDYLLAAKSKISP